MNATASLAFFWPELILIATGFLVLILDLFSPAKKWLGYLALAGVILSAFFVRVPAESKALFYGYFTLDGFSVFFKVAVLLIVAVTLLMALASREIPAKQEGELYAILTFIGVGLIMMGASSNFLMLFLSIEFVSITSYILAGFNKTDKRSNEASLKYLLFGSVSSGVMLYGMSLIFGLTGTIEFSGVRAAIVSAHGISTPMLMLALTMVLAGLAFKISAAPFHMWAPDVYTGAPTPIAAFLTVGPKALGFAALVRVLMTAFVPVQSEWSCLLAVLSALTMTAGNFIAISQTNVKRLLAYSSIAQAGYILMGVTASNHIGLSGVLVYLFAYAFTNLGAFIVVILVSHHYGTEEIDSYAGLSKKAPFLAASLTLFFISLAGIPPLAGYIGKFFVFAGVIEAKLVGLALIAAVNTAAAAFYYFKVVKKMYFMEPFNAQPIAKPFPLMLALLIAFAGVITLGLFPAPLLQFASHSLTF